ncbi:MAG TPA: DUF305 domain-containing protein [Flavisolibacter sp.]|jgi:uncharacterized protein (DUF305 family)|nr:DUF305 domain-containing protein [Flavisolibacter sp.]
MKYLMLISFAVAIAACNAGSNTAENKSGAADHAAHNTTTGGDAAGQNHMKAMHDAMNGMMEQMHNMKPTGDPDHDFAIMMKHHHQGAVDMAKVEIAGGSDTALKTMAQHAMNEQQGEMAAFDRILQGNQPSGNSDYGQRAMSMMTPMNAIKMEGGSLDAMFASMMIPHHQDAVKMAEAYLNVGKNEELKRIARSIMKTQPREIQELQQWLNKN